MSEIKSTLVIMEKKRCKIIYLKLRNGSKTVTIDRNFVSYVPRIKQGKVRTILNNT